MRRCCIQCAGHMITLHSGCDGMLVARLCWDPQEPVSADSISLETQESSCVAGYTNAYSRLVNAHKPERDPLPEVPNAANFLAQQLGKVRQGLSRHHLCCDLIWAVQKAWSWWPILYICMYRLSCIQ